MSDKIIPFPVREKEKLFASCPDCGGFSWEIEVNGPKIEKIHSINCVNPDCEYTIPLVMSINLKFVDSEQVFNFELDDNDSDNNFIFTLDEDED